MHALGRLPLYVLLGGPTILTILKDQRYPLATTIGLITKTNTTAFIYRKQALRSTPFLAKTSPATVDDQISSPNPGVLENGSLVNNGGKIASKLRKL